MPSQLMVHSTIVTYLANLFIKRQMNASQNYYNNKINETANK